MTLATINLGNDEPLLHFTYFLSCSNEISTLASSQFLDHKHYNVDGIGYTIRPQRGEKKPPALWITGKKIIITGKVCNEGYDGSLKEWTIGFIQTIHHSERNAHYENGVNRLVRLNTDTGPLKDGDPGDIYYTDTKKSGEKELGKIREKLKTVLDDAPNFEMPLQYGPSQSNLVGTSGYDEFSSHLVLVRKKSILRLGWIKWIIDWTGSFDYKTKTWKPKLSTDFLKIEQHLQECAYFPDLHINHTHTPFSLMLAEAEGFFEIKDEKGWQRCSGSGDTSKGKNPSTVSWHNS